MKSNVNQVMDWVFLSEGGYAERDSEPGGAVNMGISFTAFKDVWARLKKDRVPTFEDLKNLKRGSVFDEKNDDAEDIYAEWFFKPLHFEQLPSGVDYAFVDFAVNSGVGGSVRSVQRQLGFPVTGRIRTDMGDAPFFWAVRSRYDKDVIDAICECRLRLMMSSRKWERFQGNWTRRVNLVKTRAYKLAGIPEPVEIVA